MSQPATKPTPKSNSHVSSSPTAPKAKVTVTAPATTPKTKAPIAPKPPETQARSK